MPKPRKALVSIDDTPYYHCVSRCVRRAFLCGKDKFTGRSYEHRRSWVEQKLLALSDVFALQIAAYAVMSNHYHVVLYIDRFQAQQWTPHEVINRWHRLFKGTELSQRFARYDHLSKAEKTTLFSLVETWRSRLSSLSWYMRVLNESIARRANSEDECTGRFWEGRFKSQALLDKKALAACMAYVDLNPLRSGMASSIDKADFTSIQQRLRKAQKVHAPNHPQQQPKRLLAFAGQHPTSGQRGLPFRFNDYLALVDWTSSQFCNKKPGCISDKQPSLLDELNINQQHWLYMTQHFESRFKCFAGNVYRLREVCQKLGFQKTPGVSVCQYYLS